MEIRISVRTLVEFLLRNGDIDNLKSGGTKDAMLEGGRIHRMIQRRMGPDYHAEVPLRLRIPSGEYEIVLEGRADGIILENLSDTVIRPPEISLKDGEEEGERYALIVPEEGELLKDGEDPFFFLTVTVDEIKGTYRDLSKMKEPDPVHLAQAKCYAYIFAVQNSLSGIRVRMTYCHMETEELKYFHYDYTFDEIREWFEILIGEYRKWAEFEFRWKNARQRSIRAMEFPFSYRKGQKDLVTYVYQTIYHGRKLFIEAPTGVGKTMAALFPSIKAMGEELTGKIFYLTARTITREAPEHALSILRERGLSFKSVTLTAKEKICFQDECDCNPKTCPYAKGHFDRVNDALYDALTNLDNLNREEILRCALKYQVCPFELSLDCSLFTDMVICDYNYLFDPHAYLRRFFTEGIRGDYVFLIDEAHNLVERGRDMYSAELFKDGLLAMKKTVKDHSLKIAHAIESCNREMLSLKKDLEGEEKELHVFEEEEIAPLERRLLRLYSLIEEYLDEKEDSPIRKELLKFWFNLSHFLQIGELLDENYVIYGENAAGAGFRLKLFNVNPSQNLKLCMMRGRSSILFSATLLPIDYFKKLLGAEEGDYEVYAESVFDPEKRGLYIAKDVTSRYTRRGYDEYYRISCYIREVTKRRPGNYLVFFPSFAFLNEVAAIYREEFGEEGLIVQTQTMKEKEREEFLLKFKEQSRTLVGMCVLGGIFSEGIDLRNDSLIGALVVGTGIPMVCGERELLKSYFDRDGVSGYDYAYKFPGMNKVMQAAGRVIRTEEDVGVVALLDERFLQTGYLRLFPREWSNYRIVSKETVSEKLDSFWKDRGLNDIILTSLTDNSDTGVIVDNFVENEDISLKNVKRS
ncbi:MAG: ATP-dependent DNA helicase [Lachnospiraceae bacterium]|nr:ATP-dependent DNA helicase [Lachnospiraceae bacterium]